MAAMVLAGVMLGTGALAAPVTATVTATGTKTTKMMPSLMTTGVSPRPNQRRRRRKVALPTSRNRRAYPRLILAETLSTRLN